MVNLHYSQILYFWLHLLKFTCNPKVTTLVLLRFFMDLSTPVESLSLMFPMFMFLAEVKQTLSSGSSCQTVDMGHLSNLFSAMLFCIVSF